jgi:hypothetical protein
MGTKLAMTKYSMIPEIAGCEAASYWQEHGTSNRGWVGSA